jgi:hypothetical protein
MKSIQLLQKEQVVLLKSLNNQGTYSRRGLMESNGVMRASPLPGGSPAAQPPPPPLQSQGDRTLHPTPAFVHMSASEYGVHEHDSRRTWIPKMDFSEV